MQRLTDSSKQHVSGVIAVAATVALSTQENLAPEASERPSRNAGWPVPRPPGWSMPSLEPSWSELVTRMAQVGTRMSLTTRTMNLVTGLQDADLETLESS